MPQRRVPADADFQCHLNPFELHCTVVIHINKSLNHMNSTGFHERPRKFNFGIWKQSFSPHSSWVAENRYTPKQHLALEHLNQTTMADIQQLAGRKRSRPQVGAEEELVEPESARETIEPSFKRSRTGSVKSVVDVDEGDENVEENISSPVTRSMARKASVRSLVRSPFARTRAGSSKSLYGDHDSSRLRPRTGSDKWTKSPGMGAKLRGLSRSVR
jgi:hypothetical protein